MKVIIVGAGLSGLATALTLRKYLQPKLKEPLEITVYDEADSVASSTVEHGNYDHTHIRTKRQGAAISLQSNAFKVLRDLDLQLAERVRASGLPCKGFTWKTAGDWLLGHENLQAHIISRPLLVESLQEALPKGTVVYRTVSEVNASSSGKPTVTFSDGGTEQADLVVGADGIRSPIRKSLFGKQEETRPKHLGHVVVGGVLELEKPLPRSYLDEPRVVFIHGPNATFGYCGLSQATPNKVLYFSFYDSDLPPRGQELDFQRLTAETRERHKDWKDPILIRCLNEAAVDNLYPIFYLPDLPYWGRNGCVLVGDAAHVMTPASGQGGSQAFEDGQTLALLLAEFIETYSKDVAIEKAIQGIFDIRSPHVYKIKADGLAMKEPERPWSRATTAMVYSFFFVTTKAKWLSSFFGQTVYPAHVWDAKEEVRKYLAAGA